MSLLLPNGSASARTRVRNWLLFLVLATAGIEARAGARPLTHPVADTSFALDAEGQLWAWGDNTAGALGDGTREDRAQPRPVKAPGVARWRTAAPGRRVLAVDQDRRLWAWGYGRQGGSDFPILLSQPVVRWETAAALPGLDANLLIADTGQAWLWQFVGKAIGSSAAFSGYFLGPVEAPGAAGRGLKVAGGDSHALLLTETGQLFAYGSNHLAQCGPAVGSAFAAALVPVPSPEPGRVWVDLACGADTSFGRLSNGEWYFWGAAFVHGSNGVATVATRVATRLLRPKEVATWEQIVAGRSFILLRSEAGRAYGLGDNFFGALAYPGQRQWSLSYTNEPRRVFSVGPQTNRVTELAAGPDHALALDEHGELYTWGNNASGQLGRPANGSAWQPDRVNGERPPFSPAAEPLPELEWVPTAPKLVSPLLAGQQGQAARFLIRRRRGFEFGIPIRLEPTSEHSLPGLPWTLVHGLGGGFLAPLERDLPIALTSEPFGGTTVAAALQLRAIAPPWVVWSGGNTTPLTVNFPQQWSRPPTARLTFAAGPVLRLGQTNLLSLGCYDPDGWVSSAKLVVTPLDDPRTEVIFDRKISRGFAGLTNWINFPWVPREGSLPAGTNTIRLSAYLRDNAGSFVIKFLGYASVTRLAGDAGFRVGWSVTNPLVELSTPVSVQIEQLKPELSVVEARLYWFEANGRSQGSQPLPNVPGDNAISFPGIGSFSGRVRIVTATGWEDFALPILSRFAAEGVPYVSLVATAPEAFEGGAEGGIRLTRFGGDLGRPLRVQLGPEAVLPGSVPVPRRETSPMAVSGVDYQVLPTVVTLPAGVQELDLSVRPVDDLLAEGNEGVRWGVVFNPAAYEILPAQGEAQVVIHDNETLSLPTVEISQPNPGGVASANEALEVAVRTTTAPGSKIIDRELLAESQSLGLRLTLPAPLPVGPMTLRARVTDSFGQVAWSVPLTVEVVPELRLRGREARTDGTELWRVEAAPDFQDLRLETAPAWGEWQPVSAWRATPTNRVREVVVPAGAATHFLRLVPADDR